MPGLDRPILDKDGSRVAIAGLLGNFFRKDEKPAAEQPPSRDLPAFEPYLVGYMTQRLKLPPGTVITLGTVLTELGQNSLSLIRISGELEDKLGIEIEPALVFEAPTLGDLAVTLHRVDARGRGDLARCRNMTGTWSVHY